MNELLYAGLCIITAGAEPICVPMDNIQDNQTKSQIVSEVNTRPVFQSEPECHETSSTPLATE